jgi:hypothetical protein
VTRASDTKPTKRVVASEADGDLIAEVGEHEVVLRPARSRRGGGAEVVVPWGAIYLMAMRRRADEVVRNRRIKRGFRL